MYWTNFTDTTVSIEKARMNGARGKDRQVYVKNIKFVVLGALTVDPDGRFLYFLEKKRQRFIRLSLKGT